MTTPSGTGLPLMPRDQGMYTVREQKDLPRMPKVDAARAAGKSPKYTERMQDLLDSPTARKKVDKLINQGKDLNMTEWYGTEPLRQVAMDAGRTPEQFESLMAQLASASQRNPVDKQNQMGSYLYHLSETGQLPANSLLLTNKLKKALKEDPTLAEGRQLVELPAGYGSLAQGDIFNRAVMIGQGDIAGALPPNKKLGTFYENLLGNLKPVTVDVNAVRGPIIERGDPRWLTSKLVEKDEEGRIINSYKPREMFESGEMTMREAKQRPGFWEAAPSGSEYAGFEDLWQRGAKRHGVEPAEAQALGWYGSADVTALKTKPENYVDNLERLIKRTAEQTGQSPQKVMKDLVTGEGFLRKDGGAVDIDAADARLAAAMGQRMAKGGKVDIKAADARLSAAMAQRMAGGGGAFKKIAFMADGGRPPSKNESLQDTLKNIQNYTVLDQGAPRKPNELGGVILSGASWMAGDEKTRLAKQLFGEDVTNTAIGGQKTSDVLNQLNAFERDGGTFQKGSTVVLDIGANDIAQGVDKATIRKNLDEIVSRLGDSGVNVILSGQPEANSYEEAINSTTLQMDDLYNDIAAKHPNVTLVDAMSGMLNQKDLMDESGFHLNSDDAKLAYLSQFANAYKGANNQSETGIPKQVTQTDNVVDIPQQIAQITQASVPETYYTPDVQVAYTPEEQAYVPQVVVESEPVRSGGYNAAMSGDGLETYYQNINNYLAEPRTQEEIQDAMQFYSVSQADIDAARSSGYNKTDDSYATEQYAEGGGAFKTLQWAKPQHFDGGGIASPEESSGYAPESFFDSKRYSDIKKNAAEMFEDSKKSLASDYDRLKNSPRARAQLAKITAAQIAGGAPDLAHLGVNFILDPLKSVTVDKLLTKPAYRSVLADPPKAGEKQERVPMFGSLSEALTTEDGLPIGGSEHMIKRAQDAGLMYGSTKPFLDESGRQPIDPKTGFPMEIRTGRFGLGTEIGSAILGGAGLSKLGKSAVKGYGKQTGTNSGKLNPLQPEAMTAPAGTPQGATYATKQEGPFYRVSPTSLDVSGAKSRGLREADELQSQAPVGGSAGQAGSEVPFRISDEEVARLIADPASNQPLQIAQRFTKETQGTDFAKPDIPESSLAKQSAIGRAHQLAVEGSPEYKSSVFDAYAQQMPDVLEQAGAKNYDDLME
jgi:hypothetical protein